MRRSFAILIWILLGALAASLGIGSVLFHAKQERDELKQQLRTEHAVGIRLKQEHQRLIEEANRTVEAAVRNASATRDLLNAITQEQYALEQATGLVSPQQTRRWRQTIAFPLGISIQTPPFTNTTSTDTLIQSTIGIAGSSPVSWLSITRYDAVRFQDLIRMLSGIENVNYHLEQTLVTGVRGVSPDGSTTYVLRTQRRGVPAHLIWAKANGTMTQERILDSLATLLFAGN